MRYLIFGAGLFGKALAERLSELGAEVYVVDHSESAVEEIKDFVAGAIVGESSQRKTVEEIVARTKPDVCVACFGESFDATLLVVIYLKDMGIPHIIARASNKLQEEILYKLGVEKVILPEVMMGERLGEHIILGESEFLPLDPENAIARVRIPDGVEPFPVQDIPGKKDDIQLLFIHRAYLKDKVFKTIPADQAEEILPGDNLVVMGNPKRISGFVKKLYRELRKKEAT